LGDSIFILKVVEKYGEEKPTAYAISEIVLFEFRSSSFDLSNLILLI
jgi:hypothetical protein